MEKLASGRCHECGAEGHKRPQCPTKNPEAGGASDGTPTPAAKTKGAPKGGKGGGKGGKNAKKAQVGESERQNEGAQSSSSMAATGTVEGVRATGEGAVLQDAVELLKSLRLNKEDKPVVKVARVVQDDQKGLRRGLLELRMQCDPWRLVSHGPQSR